MKYQPCCGRRCLLGLCETRDQGGCYCVCSLKDYINSIKRVIEGKNIYDGGGFIYIPDETRREYNINTMSEERKQAYYKYKDIEAPILLKKYEEKLKTYEL